MEVDEEVGEEDEVRELASRSSLAFFALHAFLPLNNFVTDS